MCARETVRKMWPQALGLMVLLGVMGSADSARAHFILMTPDSWWSQDRFGGPQKLGPCGNEPGGTPTGIVDTFRPGDTVTVTINEVIYHPGHYRVALAVNDRAELPPDPPVTQNGFDQCGSTVIQEQPTFPILADNILPHTQPPAGPQTFTVTLPTDVTCTKCTLQVLEFMSNHGAPCFYHHCADISIQVDNPMTTTSTTVAPTAPTGGSATTTTTTLPGPVCTTAQCSIDAVVQGPCASDVIPGAIRQKLDRAPQLMEQAATSAGRKAKQLRKKAKRLLTQAGASALRASRGKKPKLTTACATSIKEAADRLAAQ